MYIILHAYHEHSSPLLHYWNPQSNGFLINSKYSVRHHNNLNYTLVMIIFANGIWNGCKCDVVESRRLAFLTNYNWLTDWLNAAGMWAVELLSRYEKSSFFLPHSHQEGEFAPSWDDDKASYGNDIEWLSNSYSIAG